MKKLKNFNKIPQFLPTTFLYPFFPRFSKFKKKKKSLQNASRYKTSKTFYSNGIRYIYSMPDCICQSSFGLQLPILLNILTPSHYSYIINKWKTIIGSLLLLHWWNVIIIIIFAWYANCKYLQDRCLIIIKALSAF